MSSEAPTTTDLTASQVKPPSPSSTNAPIEAIELVEPLELPTKVARTAWWKSKPLADQPKQHATPVLTTAAASSRNTSATAIAPTAAASASTPASGSAPASALASALATSTAAASAGASNLPVANSPAEPKRQGRPPVTAKQLNKFPIDYSWWQFKKQLENGSVTGYCTLCLKYQLDKCQFSRSCGAVVWDGNDLLTRTTSLTHKAAVTTKANPLKRAFDVVRTTGIVTAKTATQCLMATALTCIKEQLLISKFAPPLALEKFLGVDQITHKYNHSRYFWSALFSCSEVLLQKQVERIKASSSFALLIDSSTDVSTEDRLLIYVRYLHPDTLIVTTEYVTCMKLLATTTVIGHYN
ncbi:hypothetical protein CY35_03G013800 [Sphagnum magellanicum]|nr:hypothetical protein CY35_03G013800 [Sphagnum magellanicum]